MASIWLITGSTSGFGKRFVLEALSRGERVIATGRSPEKLEEVLKEVKPEHKQSVRTAVLDVTDGEDKVKTIIDQAAKYWGGFDVVINNAGAGYPGLLEEGGSKLLRRQMETNFFAVADVTNAALPYLRQSTDGRLIVVGSRSAWTPRRKGLSAYVASKSAVHAITETYMSELSEFNIKVLLVAPGAFPTEGINRENFFSDHPIPVYDDMRKECDRLFRSIDGTQRNDLDKGAKVVVDVIMGVGVAKGRPWPSHLFLGEDAEAAVREKSKAVLDTLDEWVEVTRSVKYDDLEFEGALN